MRSAVSCGLERLDADRELLKEEAERRLWLVFVAVASRLMNGSSKANNMVMIFSIKLLALESLVRDLA